MFAGDGAKALLPSENLPPAGTSLVLPRCLETCTKIETARTLSITGAASVDKEFGSEEKNKPVLSEDVLDKLLESAYVLQEHNRRMQEMELRAEPAEPAEETKVSSAGGDGAGTAPAGSPPPNEYTLTLAQIVETQHKIQLRHLALDDAMALVATRALEITRAGGAAIGMLDGKKIRYRAAAGTMTLPAGTEIDSQKSLSASCFKTSQVIRCADVAPEFMIDGAECGRRGIQSLVAVPIYHEGGIAGVLELYYATTNAFTEQDVHTCQLMAGLVTEALARAEELSWKESLASERAVMLDALEKLKPNLAALADAKPSTDPAVKTHSATSALRATPYTCRKCGHDLLGSEVFCGQCGTPRGGGLEPDLQSKVASLWEMQEAEEKKKQGAGSLVSSLKEEHEFSPTAANRLRVDPPKTDLIPNPIEEEESVNLFEEAEPAPAQSSALHNGLESTTEPRITLALEAGELEPENSEQANADDAALAQQNWSSAASARHFLEQLAGAKPGTLQQFWRARRGDIYLVIAIVLVAFVIRWAVWSDHPVAATGRPTSAAAEHKNPEEDLPLLDRMLISLGLAEAPQPLESKVGNPKTQVWVDLQTALYYCQDSDLYGKTPKGKFMTQKDAQLDQFEPAFRKPCE